MVDVLGQHGELVAAEARHGVLGPQRLLDAGRDGGEQLVAGRVAEAVVDELELVEVEEEHRDRAAAGAALRQRVLEPVEEEVAVGERREGVVEGVVARALLGGAPLDRVGEHVGDRLQEVDVLGVELAQLEGLDAEDAVGMALGLDQDDRAAARSPSVRRGLGDWLNRVSLLQSVTTVEVPVASV